MGVPIYFAYLIRNHKEMLIKLVSFKKQYKKFCLIKIFPYFFYFLKEIKKRIKLIK